MLENSFYNIRSFKNEVNTVMATLEFNPENHIFRGHFPEMPVVPGVCQVQIIMELLEKATSLYLRLTNAGSIKFLGVINPGQTPVVDVKITMNGCKNGEIGAVATIENDGVQFFKFKGIFSC